MSSRDRAILATHHVDLERSSITLFLILCPSKMVLTAALLLNFQVLFGVQHAKQNAKLLRLPKIFIFAFFVDFPFTLCYVMLAASSSLSLTPLTNLAGLL